MVTEVSGKWQVFLVNQHGEKTVSINSPGSFERSVACCRGYMCRCDHQDLKEGLIPIPFLVEPASPVIVEPAPCSPRPPHLVAPSLNPIDPIELINRELERSEAEQSRDMDDLRRLHLI